MKKNLRNAYFLTGGGTLAGIFGAGVGQTLMEANFYRNIEAIYAVSAGAFNAAYFLTGQNVVGSTIYFEDLIKEFLKPWNIPLGSAQRFWHRYIKKVSSEKMIQVLKIDYAINIVREKKRLDIDKLIASPIPLFVKLLNPATGESEYFDIRKYDPLEILRTSAALAPYYFYPRSIIDGKEFIDGGIREPIGLDWLLSNYPKQKIVIVLNNRGYKSDLGFVQKLLEGTVSNWCYPGIGRYFVEGYMSARKDLAEALLNERVLVVRPPEDNPTDLRTTDPKKLLMTFEMGKQEAYKILEFLNVSVR